MEEWFPIVIKSWTDPSQEMVLDASLFNTQHYKVGIKGKVDQSTPKKGVAPSPTPQLWSPTSLTVRFNF